jgi:hypothetical protein
MPRNSGCADQADGERQVWNFQAHDLSPDTALSSSASDRHPKKDI